MGKKTLLLFRPAKPRLSLPSSLLPLASAKYIFSFLSYVSASSISLGMTMTGQFVGNTVTHEYVHVRVFALLGMHQQEYVHINISPTKWSKRSSYN